MRARRMPMQPAAVMLHIRLHVSAWSSIMARKYSKAAGKKIEKTMKEMKAGTLRSGRSKKKVKSRKQAIAIGLSEARRAGKKVPDETSR